MTGASHHENTTLRFLTHLTAFVTACCKFRVLPRRRPFLLLSMKVNSPTNPDISHFCRTEYFVVVQDRSKPFCLESFGLKRFCDWMEYIALTLASLKDLSRRRADTPLGALGC